MIRLQLYGAAVVAAISANAHAVMLANETVEPRVLQRQGLARVLDLA